MPKDGIGNELQEGQLVQVTCDSNLLRGRIKAIQTGGLVVPGAGKAQGQQTPGIIVINADILVSYNPQNPACGNVLRIVDPEEKSIKDAIKM